MSDLNEVFERVKQREREEMLANIGLGSLECLPPIDEEMRKLLLQPTKDELKLRKLWCCF